MRGATASLLAVLVLLMLGSAEAHVLDVASLSLTEASDGRFVVQWQTPSRALAEDLTSPALFPPGCRYRPPLLDCSPSGLVGTLSFPWLEGTRTRVMVEIAWRDGHRLSRVASAETPAVALHGAPSARGAWRVVARDYLGLGVEHILTGFDHLLFVLGLVLLVTRRRMLFATITAFTAAHSASLAATTLGWLDVPAAPVEATIALSIVLVASEALQVGTSLTRRAPWAVAFVFGLLHGLGFASALRAIGLPAGHVPVALLFFNLGVEAGQLAAIAAFAAVVWVVGKAGLRRPWLRTVAIYAMGSVAACWSLERVAGLFGG